MIGRFIGGAYNSTNRTNPLPGICQEVCGEILVDLAYYSILRKGSLLEFTLRYSPVP